MDNNRQMVQIFILNWNTIDTLMECINSLKKMAYNEYNITIIDNGSEKEIQDKLKEKIKDINIIFLQKNIGFTGASNYAFNLLKKTESKYICFISNDVIVNENFLKPMIDLAETDKKIAMISPKIYFYNTDKKIWFSNGYFSMMKGRGIHKNFKKEDSDKFNTPKQVNFVSGCVYLLRKSVLNEVKGFDNDFFNYCEDADLVLRILKKGYKCYVQPKSIVWHKESYSIRKNKGKAYQVYYLTRNTLLLAKKHFNFIQKIQFYFYFIIRKIILQSIYYLFIFDLKKIQALLKALIDYKNQKFGFRLI